MTDLQKQDAQPDPDVVCTVCVANYNGMKVIDSCLKSVLVQDCSFSVEIIVHDDASTDGSADYIAAHYPQVTLIRSDRNVGFCVSNNRMAARARGYYLLLLNNDATLFPDALRTLNNLATREQGRVVLTLPQYDAETGTLVDRGLRLDPFLNPVPNLDPQRMAVATAHGACLWVPADLWRELGGFPEWFQMMAEDLYICCMARLRGARVMVAPLSGFRHHIGYSLGGGKALGAQLATTLRRRTLSERNKNFVMTICYPLSALLVILPLHAALLLFEGMVLALVRRDPRIFTRIYLGSLTALWWQRRNLRAQHRAVRAARPAHATSFFAVFTLVPQKLRLLLRHGFPRIQG